MSDYLHIFPFPSNIDLVIRNVSSLQMEMKGGAPFSLILAANSLISDPNCVALAFN